MNKITIINFGDNKYDFISLGIKHYLDKLKHYCTINWIQLNEQNNKNINIQLKLEKDLILKNIPNEAKVYILDINAKNVNSNEFSQIIANGINKHICFIIGSSNGFDSYFKTNYLSISFGKITLPHKLFKIVLLEQIYRGYNIINNTKYHK